MMFCFVFFCLFLVKIKPRNPPGNGRAAAGSGSSPRLSPGVQGRRGRRAVGTLGPEDGRRVLAGSPGPCGHVEA